jgi:glycine dehydrogenase subunit 1
MIEYIPHTEDDIKEMLEAIGVSSIDELFSSIPFNKRLKRPLNLPAPLSEMELIRYFKDLSRKNGTLDKYISFLGGGVYNHYIPKVIEQIISRSEFYTPYTPYQPEISQGILQAIYEYQTLICQLTGMEVSNASMYDGATSLAEAILMSKRIKKGNNIFISKVVHPEYRDVVRTYLDGSDIDIIEVPYDHRGLTDYNYIDKNIDNDTISITIQSPNFFGLIEDLSAISEIIDSRDIIFIVSVLEPISLGIINPPGYFNADIVVGEGQALGNPISLGGPSLGIFATRDKYVRNMPGRIVGETIDRDGKRGYILTLSTREQHIRREKATSNICTNETLCAIRTAIYLALLGKDGLKDIAKYNLYLTYYAKKKLSNIPKFRIKFNSPGFNEFILESEYNIDKLLKWLLRKGIIGGLNIERFYPELKNSLLISFTENNSIDDIDKLYSLLVSYERNKNTINR